MFNSAKNVNFRFLFPFFKTVINLLFQPLRWWRIFEILWLNHLFRTCYWFVNILGDTWLSVTAWLFINSGFLFLLMSRIMTTILSHNRLILWWNVILIFYVSWCKKFAMTQSLLTLDSRICFLKKWVALIFCRSLCSIQMQSFSGISERRILIITRSPCWKIVMWTRICISKTFIFRIFKQI